MLTKSKLLGLIAIGAILTASAVTAVASGLIINVRNPGAVQKGPALVPPALLPPGQEGYINWRSDTPITAPDGQPVAQLAKPPAGIAQAVAVYLPDDHSVQDPAEVSYTILASIRYTGNGHTVFVSTARPSPAAAQQSTLLGNQTVKLANGVTAWMRARKGNTPSQIVWVRDDLIITVAGDLALDDLQALAADVVIK